MRTNEEILAKENTNASNSWDFVSKKNAVQAMKEAQKEIIEFVLQKAADSAKCEHYYNGRFKVNEDSILSLKDEIIKEIDLKEQAHNRAVHTMKLK